MRIAYVSRVSLPMLVGTQAWDSPLPSVRWGFPLGSETVNRLVARGHEVHVITDHPVDRIMRYNAGALTVWLVPSWHRSRWSFLSLFAKEVRGFRRCLADIRPDVVFAQWTYYNARAALTSGFPSLVVAHDSPWRILATVRNVQALIKALYAQILVFPKLRFLTTVSAYMVEELRRFNGYRGEARVVPNGIRMPSHEVEPNIRAEAQTIICVSQWDRRKNVIVLLRAFEILRTRHADWSLVLYGQGLDASVAGRWMARQGVRGDGVRLCGMAERAEIMRAIRDEADVFCSPSLEESFGMVFVEAMVQGVPCVGGAKSGAVPWVLGVEPGQAEGAGGVVCDVTDPQALAACLERVMLDEGLRRHLSAGGIRRVRDCFDIEKVVDQYETLLKKVADGAIGERDVRCV